MEYGLAVAVIALVVLVGAHQLSGSEKGYFGLEAPVLAPTPPTFSAMPACLLGGPTTSGVTITPSDTSSSPTISAVVTASGAASCTTTAAEVFVDTPGGNGSGIAMSGTFGTQAVSVSLSSAAFSGAFSALADGTHTVYVNGEDSDGVWGPLAQGTFTKDTTPPATPSTPSLAAGSDSGASSTDNITNVTTPTLVGTAEANSTVTVYDGATALGVAAVSSGGSWSFTVPSALANGVHKFTVTATDAAGNTSSPSGVLSVTIDTVPPDTTITSKPASSTSSTSASFSFTSTEAGSTFQCQLDSGSATACNSGSVSYTKLANGSHTFSVAATDVAGNPDPTPATYTWTVDTTAPAVTLTSPANGSATKNAQPTFSGAAGTAPGDASSVTVTIYSGTKTSGTVVMAVSATVSGGSYSVAPTSPLPDGTYTAQTSQTDASGNTGTSSANTFTVDTVAPSAPTNLALTPGTGTLTAAWSASSDPSPSSGLTGYTVYFVQAATCPAPNPVNGTDAGYPNQQTTTSTSLTVQSLTTGQSYCFYVVAKDGAGNTSSPSNVASGSAG